MPQEGSVTITHVTGVPRDSVSVVFGGNEIVERMVPKPRRRAVDRATVDRPAHLRLVPRPDYPA